MINTAKNIAPAPKNAGAMRHIVFSSYSDRSKNGFFAAVLATRLNAAPVAKRTKEMEKRITSAVFTAMPPAVGGDTRGTPKTFCMRESSPRQSVACTQAHQQFL